MMSRTIPMTTAIIPVYRYKDQTMSILILELMKLDNVTLIIQSPSLFGVWFCGHFRF